MDICTPSKKTVGPDCRQQTPETQLSKPETPQDLTLQDLESLHWHGLLSKNANFDGSAKSFENLFRGEFGLKVKTEIVTVSSLELRISWMIQVRLQISH